MLKFKGSQTKYTDNHYSKLPFLTTGHTHFMVRICTFCNENNLLITLEKCSLLLAFFTDKIKLMHALLSDPQILCMYITVVWERSKAYGVTLHV